MANTKGIEDDTRPDRPIVVISQEMIDCVERLVLNDRRIKDAEPAIECVFFLMVELKL